eukprot:SAG31_NODE_3212_length_4544_cov_1.849719_6_plen_139_part_00
MAEQWYPSERTQVLSFGAGFDSTYFHLAESGCLPHKYVEVDFPELVATKIRIINESTELAAHTRNMRISENGALLTAESYGLVGCDLRQLGNFSALLKAAGLDLSLPTLCLSECVMTYMAPADSSGLIGAMCIATVDI